MHLFPKHPRIPTSILAALVLPLALGATASADPVRVRGSVVSLDGAKLVVRSKDGKDVPITLKDNYAALAAVKSSMADIKPGRFIGTATVTQPNSSMRSVEVVVFAESLRGTAEGHYPWDLGSNSMMTNGSIGNAVQGVDGQTVTVTYKGGEEDRHSQERAGRRVGAWQQERNRAGRDRLRSHDKQADGTLVGGAVVYGRMAPFPRCNVEGSGGIRCRALLSTRSATDVAANSRAPHPALYGVFFVKRKNAFPSRRLWVRASFGRFAPCGDADGLVVENDGLSAPA